jgi:hypothetical protein
VKSDPNLLISLFETGTNGIHNNDVSNNGVFNNGNSNNGAFNNGNSNNGVFNNGNSSNSVFHNSVSDNDRTAVCSSMQMKETNHQSVQSESKMYHSGGGGLHINKVPQLLIF